MNSWTFASVNFSYWTTFKRWKQVNNIRNQKLSLRSESWQENWNILHFSHWLLFIPQTLSLRRSIQCKIYRQRDVQGNAGKKWVLQTDGRRKKWVLQTKMKNESVQLSHLEFKLESFIKHWITTAHTWEMIYFIKRYKLWCEFILTVGHFSTIFSSKMIKQSKCQQRQIPFLLWLRWWQKQILLLMKTSGNHEPMSVSP